MLWVAEIGSLHKGDKSLAYEMIRRFSQAGASIIKFQFGWNKKAQKAMGLDYNPIRYVDDWALQLDSWCQYFDVELMASIWSMEGLESARMVGMKRYKIGHQMQDQELIEAIYSDGKEVFHSPDNIYVSPHYPTYPRQLQMPNRYNDEGYIGYSDHTHGIEACLLAVARGATYIEKHVCLDKTDLVTRDTPFSAMPEEFAELVRIGTGMRRLLDAGV